MGDDIHDFFDDDLDSWPETGDGGGLTPPTPPRSRREMRLKRKRSKQHRFVKVVVAVMAILLVVGAGIAAVHAVRGWRHAGVSDQSIVEDYPGPGSGSVSFTIQQGEGALQVAQHLVDEDVIKSTEAFTSVVSANGMTLYPGTYQLRHQMKASSVAAILSDQGNAKGFLEVRQGERLSTVLENAAQATDQSVSVFTDAIEDQEVIDAILPDEANGSFEGWLQPGVYDVAQDKDPQHLLKQMVDARIAQLDELGVPQGEERERILIIASIVEAEVNQDEYYGKVSRVIYNRLDQDMSLGMDSTVAYGFDTTGTQLTNDQLNDESNPYNTRVHKGLPPTPISNPGDEAIEAAMHPTDGNWLYFVTTNLETGETKFTDDYDTFEQYVQEYKANEGAN